MTTKKNKKSQKIPERSISDKINFYKGETRSLRTRLKNLEKRIADLEATLGSIKKLLPKDEEEVKCIKSKITKNTDKETRIDEARKRFMQKFKLGDK